MKSFILIVAFLYLFLKLRFYKQFNQILIKACNDKNCKKKQANVVMCLLKADANIKFVKRLIANGNGVNTKDIDGKTVLMYATHYSSSIKIVKLIISYVGNLKEKDNTGKTALDYAYKNVKNKKIAKLIQKIFDKEKNAASSIKNLPEEKEKLPTIKNKEQDRLPSGLTINNNTRKNINFKTGKPENTTIFHSQTE